MRFIDRTMVGIRATNPARWHLPAIGRNPQCTIGETTVTPDQRSLAGGERPVVT
jgi:hypothetical protein